MTSIFEDGALHPGRDAADSWWIPIAHAADWDGAVFADSVLDPARGVVELAPAPLAPGDDAWSVVGPDGTEYRSDPIADRVTWRRPCDATASPVPGTGGAGWSTGSFIDPAGLALDDRGWLYVADRGNHRVQVIAPDEARVVIAIGAIDAWGRPAAGSGRGQLTEPVAVAIGSTRIFVGEATGRVVVFDRMFRFDRSFVAAPPGGAPAAIVGIAVIAPDVVVVADAGRSHLMSFSCAGAWLGTIGFADAPHGLGWLAERARFATEGTVVLGPIDGGLDRLAWHEIIVDAVVPDGTSIEVQTFAGDPEAVPPTAPPPPPPPLTVATPWAPALPVAIPTIDEPTRGEATRPVLSDMAAWERWQHAPFLRGALVHEFTGDGPFAVGFITLPAAAARVLRTGDDIELRGAAGVAPATVLAIPDRTATIEVAGPDFASYAGGATVTLVERDGRAVGTVIHTLAAAEIVSLTGFTTPGEVGDVVLPHPIASLLRSGDVVEIVAALPATDHDRLRVDAIDGAPAIVTIAPFVLGDFRRSTLHVVTSVDRLVVDHADGWGTGFPPGGSITVAWDDAGTIASVDLVVAWSDPETATVWTTVAAPATWLSFSPGSPPVATDRGRYLWVRLRLRGARRRSTDALATATPTVRALRLVAPRPSYLGFLPAVFSRRDDRDPSGALFLERYLAVIENRLTDVEGSYEAVARLLNPLAADDDWLRFVAGWFDILFDPSWPRDRRARLITEIFALYRKRGTADGIRRAIEIYTGHRPELIEGFQIRPRAGLVVGCHGVVGCAPLGGLDTGAAADEGLLGAYAHRFTLVTYVDDDCDLAVATTAIQAIVDAIKPAHTDVDLQIVVPDSRVGMTTTVGLDFLLGDDRSHPPAPLGTRAAAPPRPAPILGVDARLPAVAGPLPLDNLAGSTVGDLTLG